MLDDPAGDPDTDRPDVLEDDLGEPIAGDDRAADTGVLVAGDMLSDIEIPILDMDPEGYDRQIERLNEVRRSRDDRECARTLKALESALRNDENVMPYLLDAVNAYATLQECCDVMRDVLGVYSEAAIV